MKPRPPACDCLTRRALLGAAAAAGTILVLPRWLRADDTRKTPVRRTIVLLHLTGGNDGLNTVVPYADRRYARLRPTIGVDTGAVIRLENGLGLHPSLGGLERLLRKGLLAVVNGVGYPDPDYSHFRSTEIWYTARPTENARVGWMGRALDQRPSSSPLRAAALAKEPPLSLHGDGAQVATLSDFGRFRLPDGLEGVATLYAKARDAAGPLGGVGRAGADALAVAERIAGLKPADGPFQGPLGEDLKKVVALLEADLDLEAIQLSFDGFDTHANQAGHHAQLLQQLGDNLAAFQERLARKGADERTVTMVFSEFGRRPEENASGGTDHGSAAPVFVLGKGVRPGILGAYPSLDDLDDGNFRFTTDFRRIYAALLRHAFDLDPTPVVGPHEPLEVFA